METGKIRPLMVAVVLIGWLATVIQESEAQSTATCATSLGPCADYLNATHTHPPATCCNPLKEALANQKECLCNIFNNTALLKSFNINVTDALSLPTRCNITTGSSSNICAAASSPSPATTNTSTAPPTGSGKNAADIVGWSGVSAVLAVIASLVLY